MSDESLFIRYVLLPGKHSENIMITPCINLVLEFVPGWFFTLSVGTSWSSQCWVALKIFLTGQLDPGGDLSARVNKNELLMNCSWVSGQWFLTISYVEIKCASRQKKAQSKALIEADTHAQFRSIHRGGTFFLQRRRGENAGSQAGVDFGGRKLASFPEMRLKNP